MQCPKCNAPFQKATFADGVADRCTNCLGIWLDDQEHELLKGIATSVDIGNSRKGARFNKIDQISCPVCPDTPLLRLVDPDQPISGLRVAHPARAASMTRESIGTTPLARLGTSSRVYRQSPATSA